MRNSLAIIVFAASSIFNVCLSTPMDNKYLSVTIKCHNNPICTFNESEILVDIVVANIGTEDVGFPFAYIKRRGVTVTLTDQISHAKIPLRINLAPYNLLKDFSVIKPGQSLTLYTLIKRSEVLAFRDKFVDLVAEISPSAKIRIGERADLIPFNDVATLRIRGVDTLGREVGR